MKVEIIVKTSNEKLNLAFQKLIEQGPTEIKSIIGTKGAPRELITRNARYIFVLLPISCSIEHLIGFRGQIDIDDVLIELDDLRNRLLEMERIIEIE